MKDYTESLMTPPEVDQTAIHSKVFYWNADR